MSFPLSMQPVQFDRSARPSVPFPTGTSNFTQSSTSLANATPGGHPSTGARTAFTTPNWPTNIQVMIDFKAMEKSAVRAGAHAYNLLGVDEICFAGTDMRNTGNMQVINIHASALPVPVCSVSMLNYYMRYDKAMRSEYAKLTAVEILRKWRLLGRCVNLTTDSDKMSGNKSCTFTVHKNCRVPNYWNATAALAGPGYDRSRPLEESDYLYFVLTREGNPNADPDKEDHAYWQFVPVSSTRRFSQFFIAGRYGKGEPAGLVYVGRCFRDSQFCLSQNADRFVYASSNNPDEYRQYKQRTGTVEIVFGVGRA